MNEIIKFLKVFTFNFPGQFFIVIVAVFIQALANSLSVFAIGPLAEVLLQTKPEDYSQVTLFVSNLFGYKTLPVSFSFFVFGVSLVFAGLVSVAIQYLVFKTQYSILGKLLSDTMEQFFNSKYEFFSGTSIGELINTFQKESDKLGASFGSLTKLFVNLIQAIFFISIPLYISFKLTSIFFVCLILTAFPIWLINSRIGPYGEKVTATANTLVGVLQESFSAAKLILSFHRKDRMIEDYKKAFWSHANVSILFQSIIYATGILFMPLGMCAGLIAINWGYQNGVAIASISMILFAFFRMMPVIGVVIQSRTEIKGFLPAFEQIERLTLKAKKMQHKNGTKILKSIENISLNDIQFSYQTRKDVLKNINVNINKGDNIAIVGTSGSGKTTLIDILLGLHSPQKGSFLVNNVDFNDYDIESYRKIIGYVPQEPFLFNTSILENFRWSKPDCTEKEIWESLEISNCLDFVKQLPNGLKTNLGDRGGSISGGQRQRLALARAIIKNPSLLILDEATSSLDNESEKHIQKSINEISKNITMVTIAHRLSTIKNSNFVYVMENGHIIESDEYEILIKNDKSKFSKMLSSQFN